MQPQSFTLAPSGLAGLVRIFLSLSVLATIPVNYA